MSDYSKITNFLSKDSLPLNDPAKYVKGSEIDAECNAIAASIATKADTASPTLVTPNIGAATGTSLALGGGTALTTTNRTGTGNLVLATAPTLTGLTVSGGNFVSRGISDTATAVALTLSGSGANSVTIANSAGNPTIGTSAGGLQLNGSGGTGLLIDSSGNVGLNTQAGFSAIGKGLEIQDASVNVGLRVERTGTGASIGELFAADGIVRLNTAGAYPIGFGTNNVEQVRVLNTASANQYITLTGDVSNGPRISVGGAANANLYLSSGAGTGSISIYTNNIGSEQVRINHTESANRYITLTGSNGGNPTIGTSAGNLSLSAPVECGSSLTASTHVFASGYVQIKLGTATPAGGAAQTGLFMGSAAIGVYFGSGAPTVSGAKGSIYLRSDGTTTNNRMYVNTDGATTWTAVTTAA